MHLYAEQLSGTAFTAPRAEGKNLRTWLYRVKPSVTHQPFRAPAFPNDHLMADFTGGHGDHGCCVTPNQLRWFPLEVPPKPGGGHAPTDFVRGLKTFCGAGSAAVKDGYAIHVYAFNADMERSCLANADGDMLIVPQLGELRVKSEMGVMRVPPGHVCVVPRGIRFSVGLEARLRRREKEGREGKDQDHPTGVAESDAGGAGDEEGARGYVLEIFSGHFELPNLGPIGANGLAAARDFETPVAAFDAPNRRDEWRVVHKFLGELFEADQDFSPFNVVAWHGNYVPYRYDLSKFCPMNAVSFDHPDPSIFTVLTCPGTGSRAGAAVADFVVFPPRINATTNTFRPPYYHRNSQTEFMGLISGQYEAKVDGGFLPGGASLHSCMTPHGPDAGTFERASAEGACDEATAIGSDALAFMFEMDYIPRVTAHALASQALDKDYYRVWTGLKSFFDPNGAAMNNGTTRLDGGRSGKRDRDASGEEPEVGKRRK